MEKRFIVIKCETLGDQWECDADRKIQPKLYTEEEVKTLFHKESYLDYIPMVEVYEIKDTNLIFREDLSTYES